MEYQDFLIWLEQLFMAVPADEQLLYYRPLVKARLIERHQPCLLDTVQAAKAARKELDAATKTFGSMHKQAANRTFEVQHTPQA